MKTTIDIPGKLCKQSMRLTSASKTREAVVKAMEEFDRPQRPAQLTQHPRRSKRLLHSKKELDKRQGKDWL